MRQCLDDPEAENADLGGGCPRPPYTLAKAVKHKLNKFISFLDKLRRYVKTLVSSLPGPSTNTTHTTLQ